MKLQSKLKFNFAFEDDKDPEPDLSLDTNDESDDESKEESNKQEDSKEETNEKQEDNEQQKDKEDKDNNKESKSESKSQPSSQGVYKSETKPTYDNIVNGNSPTIIISAFPTLGKSTYCNNYDDVLDLESSVYSKKIDGSRNEEFPKNYVDMIKFHLINNNWRYIFVASHKETREALKNDKIKFYTLYPTLEKKKEVLECCKSRGNSEEFIKLIKDNYESWVEEMSKEPDSYGLEPGEFINDELFDKKLSFLKR